MRAALLLLFAPMICTAPAAAAEPAKAAEIGGAERDDLYEEHGMNYAKGLYLGLDGSPEDENRSKKSEALNHRIRERSIRKLESHLAKAKEPRIRQELLHRLSQMHEQQAEIITRRSDIKDKETPLKQALRNSIRYLMVLKNEFPKFSPDATIFNLAENHAKLKEDQKAEFFYREVISRFPKSAVVADSLLSLGNLYFERQAFLTARSFYQKILNTEEMKLYPYAHYKMAWCFFNESDFPSAVARLEQSIYESRKLTQGGDKKLGVEEEALSDLVLFFAEYGSPGQAKEYFEKLVDREKANELRYNLARRLFEHGKHQVAKEVANQLLAEKPQKEFVNKLYLILISVAERTKDRDFGLRTAEKLATWLKSEKLPESDAGRVESEEYMRLYSQKLHHEAETLKDKEVWGQAEKSYEIYLNTFPNETETAEVKFRYAVLLLNRKDQLKAYRAVTEAVAKMDDKHPRFKEALKIRIQSIELASVSERKQIEDRDLLEAYDAYAKAFPAEELGIEAKYKAAGLAKKLETPEQAAGRFRAIAEAHPEHNLAKASVSEALAVLVSAQKWEALGAESRALSAKMDMNSSLMAKDGDLVKRVSEARELSMVKITEGLEGEGKLEEARVQYEKILTDSPSETMGIFAYVRLAALSEQKLQQNREAIKYFLGLKEKYPASKEARQASLELARLFEKVNEPREAVRRYLDFSAGGSGKLEIQAMTNSAVLLEELGEREQAAEVFFRLSQTMQAGKSPDKDVASAYEAGCNNVLLSSHQNREKRILMKIQECASRLSAQGNQPVLWQARAAWAMDQSADSLQAENGWRKIAGRSLKATPEAERAYVAMAKLRVLEESLGEFREIRFTRTNEKPEANIGKKTKGLEEIERLSETLIKIGTPKQILSAKNVMRLAYLEFAETMETAAVPSKLSDGEKEELKKSFLSFGKEFRERASSLEVKDDGGRAIASTDTPKANELKMPSLSREESNWIESGAVPQDKAAELFAKKAFSLYRDGKFGEARYFSEKWKKQVGALAAGQPFGAAELELFQAMLSEKIPDLDPVSRDF
jgi:tetratricopeptide (TPR) repeat protein